MKKTGEELAKCALLDKWNKYKYEQLDCQAFVEEVIKDLGIRKPDGSIYNWRGANSMYRNYYTFRGTIDECIAKYGCLPVGAFVYVWTATGQELVGYYDDLGNCKHVGLFCGDNIVRDSTRSTKTHRDGVGSRTLDGFTHCSLFSGVDYNITNSYNSSEEDIKKLLSSMQKNLDELGVKVSELFRG